LVTDFKQYAASMHRVIAALSHRLTPEEVADGVVHEAAAIFDASACMVALFDEERDRIRVVAARGYPASVSDRWTGKSMAELPVLAAVRRGEPVFTASRVSDARFDVTLAQQFGDGAGFVVPLQAGGRVLGGLGMSFDHVRDFDAGEREFIMSLAGHCAQSLERARLFESARAATIAAEAAHRELEAVLHQLPMGVAVTRLDGRIVINDEAQRIFGTAIRSSTVERRDQVYPASMMKHLDGRDYAADEVPIARALRGESVAAEEMYMTTADGSLRIVRVNAAPIRDDGGNISAAVAVFTDITREHEVDETLRKNERRYRAVLRATSDVIWEVDAKTHAIEWNGALERQFGHVPQQIDAYPGGGLAWWMDHIHPDDREAVLQSYNAAHDQGEEIWISEYRLRRADGSYVATFDRCVFERDVSGQVVRIIGAITDVSEQRRLLDELRGAVRVRDDFLSIAGHELRTPLAALAAQLLGLRQLPLDETRRAQKISAAERQTRRLGRLVDELLDVSRIVHGKLQLQRDHVDLAAVLLEATARLEEEFQRGATPLVVDATTPAYGRWDRLRLDLIVTNLLTNALRYGEKRPVRARVEADGVLARVIVADEGMGIRAEDRERIFERFVRAVPARQFGGLGVGLWLARQIAEAHGGSLRVTSEPGAGATFTLELPQMT
jgi:PAS domain S-box-containing protein